MTLHPLDRWRGSRRRTHSKRGFTLIEVLGALTLLVVVSGLVATATMSAIAARTVAADTAALELKLATLADRLVAAPFGDLATGTALVPDPCGANTTIVAGGTSSISGTSLCVNWTVTQPTGPAPANYGQATGLAPLADAVTVTGTVTRTDGGTSTVTRTKARTKAFERNADGSTTYTVHVAGDVDYLDRPLLLLGWNATTSAYDNVLAAATPNSAGTAEFVVAPAAQAQCSASAPVNRRCRVGLGTGPTRGYDDTVTLDAATVAGTDGAVSFDSPSGAADRTVVVSRRGLLEIDVWAATRAPSSPADVQASSLDATDGPPRGTLCLFVTFADGVATQKVPACNGGGATGTFPERLVRFDTYLPDATGDAAVAIPSGVDLNLYGDTPGTATCPYVPGQRYFDATGGWTDVTGPANAVCSSWTWGYPSAVTAPSLPAGDPWTGATASTLDQAGPHRMSPLGTGMRVRVAPGAQTRYRAEYADNWSAPARGLDGAGARITLWGAPRVAASPCAPGSCAPGWLTNAAATPPEVSSCSAASPFCASAGAAANIGPYVRSFEYLTGTSTSYVDAGTSGLTGRSWPLMGVASSGGTPNGGYLRFGVGTQVAGARITATATYVDSATTVRYCKKNSCNSGVSAGTTITCTTDTTCAADGSGNSVFVLRVHNVPNATTKVATVRLTNTDTGATSTVDLWVTPPQSGSDALPWKTIAFPLESFPAKPGDTNATSPAAPLEVLPAGPFAGSQLTLLTTGSSYGAAPSGVTAPSFAYAAPSQINGWYRYLYNGTPTVAATAPAAAGTYTVTGPAAASVGLTTRTQPAIPSLGAFGPVTTSTAATATIGLTDLAGNPISAPVWVWLSERDGSGNWTRVSATNGVPGATATVTCGSATGFAAGTTASGACSVTLRANRTGIYQVTVSASPYPDRTSSRSVTVAA